MGDIAQVAFNFGHFPEFRALDWNLKAEQERKRVVDAVLDSHINVFSLSKREIAEALYDLGFLKLPEGYNK